MHLIESQGIYIHNSPQTIEKTVDKVRTSGILKINNILAPDTKVTLKNSIKIKENRNYKKYGLV